MQVFSQKFFAVEALFLKQKNNDFYRIPISGVITKHKND